jgi:ribonucleases P/MRP protein subunit RPP40
VFIDLHKAFDVCSHEILPQKLKHFGIKDKALDWVRIYLTNQVQQVDIDGNLSEQATLNISVLQGSILGPILYLCFINDLPNSSALKTLLFTDDTQGYAARNNFPALMDQVNRQKT